MNEREIFHKLIADNPKERTIHLVFADWLEEQGELFEAAIRRCDVKFCSDKTTVWIDNKPYCLNGKDHVKMEIKNIEYSQFQKQSFLKVNYNNVFVIGEDQCGITDISIYHVMWNDGTVVIEAFAENIK